MRRIHIVCASPRTGSTLMAEAMRTCFDIDVGGAHEERIFAPPPRPGRIYLSKYPHDVHVVGPLLRVLPKLYVIYLVRDPRDIIVSRHSFEPDKYWVGLNFWKTYHPYGYGLRRHKRFLTLRYEDFVNDPDATQRLIQARFDFLERRALFSEYHLHAQPPKESVTAMGSVRPIQPKGIGNWRQNLPRVAGQIVRHGPITKDLIQYGYEDDDQWLELLKDVEPDMQPSRRRETLPPRKIARERKKAYRYAARALKRRLLGQPLPNEYPLAE